MAPDEIKRLYGEEYPAVMLFRGDRLPFLRETRWRRLYGDKTKMLHGVSRFMDGSASITFLELASEWSSWGEKEQVDFCGACSWLHKQPDFPDMLRHIMQHGPSRVWWIIAISVATHLPQQEAYEWLLQKAVPAGPENSANLYQAISITRHPDAVKVLRAHLNVLWRHESLWLDDKFSNIIAYRATCCIKNLIDVGVPAHELVTYVRDLAGHPCSGNRESCVNFLGEHYPWLIKTEERTAG